MELRGALCVWFYMLGHDLECERGCSLSMISSAKTQPYQIIDHCETASTYVTLMSAIP